VGPVVVQRPHKELILELNAIELTITDGDLRAIIDKYVRQDDLPVSDLDAHIGADGVIVRGKYQAAFLKGSFEATVSLAADGQVVLAALADLKALGPVGNMFKGTLTSALQKKLGDIPGVSGDKDTIRIDAARLLAERGLAVQVATLEIHCAPGRLTLKLSGSIDCAV
jgi:hypothetical protein